MDAFVSGSSTEYEIPEAKLADARHLADLVRKREELRSIPWLVLIAFLGLGISVGARYFPNFAQPLFVGSIVLGVLGWCWAYFGLTRPMLSCYEASIRAEVDHLGTDFLRNLAEHSHEFAPLADALKSFL